MSRFYTLARELLQAQKEDDAALEELAKRFLGASFSSRYNQLLDRYAVIAYDDSIDEIVEAGYRSEANLQRELEKLRQRIDLEKRNAAAEVKKKLDDTVKQCDSLKKQCESLKKENEELKKRMATIEESRSYRLASKVMHLARGVAPRPEPAG